MSSTLEQIETSVEIVTPENIAFHYRVAGPFRRLPAYLIDTLIRVVFVVLVLLVLAFTVGLQLGAAGMLLVFFVIEWFYAGLFETFWNGQTPGKHLMRLRVLSVDGQPITGIQAILRSVMRSVDSLPTYAIIPNAISIPMYTLGLVSTLFGDRYQRLGDRIAGTMVVVEERPRGHGVVRFSEPAVHRLAAQLPVSFQVSRSLARALSSYVLRRRALNRRRLEIANHVAEPLRAQFGLPATTNPDLLLCSLYHRTFLVDPQEAGVGLPDRENQAVPTPGPGVPRIVTR